MYLLAHGIGIQEILTHGIGMAKDYKRELKIIL